MMENILLTPAARRHLDQLSGLVPGIDEPFLVETALALAAALYQRSKEGNLVQVVDAQGKTEELRFKVKKSPRKKSSLPGS